MATIIINDKLQVKGKVSFNREKVLLQNVDEERYVMECTGVLSTHLYIDQIDTIETERCIAKDVDVYSESIGSDDYNIMYHFRFGELIMKGTELKIDEDSSAFYIITPKEMEMIENEMYKNEHPYLGDIGEEYKDFYEEVEE